MNSTAILVSGSSATGDRSSAETSTTQGLLISREFFAGRPLPLPNARALSEVIAGYEADPIKGAAMKAARHRLGPTVHANRAGGLGALRMSCGFSQSGLAAAAATSQPHIAKIESGKNDPSTSLIARIAEVLAVPPELVFMAVRSDQTAGESAQ